MAQLDYVSNTWAQIISSITNIPAKNTIWSVIQRLVLGASVYFLWQERNVRLFSNYGRSENELFKIIVESVRSRIMGLKLQVTTDVIKAVKIWSFPIDKMLMYKFLLDKLLADNMDIDEDN
ncbi:Phytosulfokine [Artemisia annua]|uniref:Phytosulfokine n=1 Tax=Artemisia annua TaxID=35608 RepID=A0A2U1LQN8_ARTAN|nr:Phytosulfokine [Artemisia annua]